MTSEAVTGTVERLTRAVDAELAATGRSRDGFTVAAYHNVVVGDTREAAHEEGFRFLSAYTGAAMTPELARTWTAAGRPEDCAADLQALVDLGVDVITLRLTSYDQAAQYDRLVEEVLPLLSP
jgi:alkanesulfonate monooxygenase SsuD/methylene tetrahydromethanopterin reductase-like flavin-dependent oxidoreductase (luciferase family)